MLAQISDSIFFLFFFIFCCNSDSRDFKVKFFNINFRLVDRNAIFSDTAILRVSPFAAAADVPIYNQSSSSSFYFFIFFFIFIYI
jgi:hypothetical protein